MKHIKKKLSLSRETIRPLADAALQDVGAALGRTPTIFNLCASVPRTGCTSCPSYGAYSNCCLWSVQIC